MDRILPQELIRAKRDGDVLPAAAIQGFVRGLTDGSITDAQVAAFAMAVHFQGMTRAECVALTDAMTDSGVRLAWPELDGPVLDKHSTGGLGDKVSLMLAPMLAACGGYVPMISGRGLGHTGGTLDKLDSIPGYVTTPSREVFRDAVQVAGCAIVGQTGELAPADDRFYAIRDVTATVDPIALITASILSKKLAAGLDALVMDVKFGTGAFSRDLAEARALAESITAVAAGAGLATHALLTDMNQILGSTAGNALEVMEVVEYLRGTKRDPRLHALVMALGTELLAMGGLAPSAAAAERLERCLADGTAAERFERMVVALGGPSDLLASATDCLPVAPVVLAVNAPDAGFVRRIAGRAVGMAIVALGGGRQKPSDTIDPRVGLSEVVGLGERTDAERPLALVHAADQASAEACAATLRACFEVGEAIDAPGPIVCEHLREPTEDAPA